MIVWHNKKSQHCCLCFGSLWLLFNSFPPDYTKQQRGHVLMEKRGKDKGKIAIRKEGTISVQDGKESNKRIGKVGDLRVSLVSSSLIPLREKQEISFCFFSWSPLSSLGGLEYETPIMQTVFARRNVADSIFLFKFNALFQHPSFFELRPCKISFEIKFVVTIDKGQKIFWVHFVSVACLLSTSIIKISNNCNCNWVKSNAM